MIIDKARELGLALSESPEFQEMLRARAAVDADAHISGLIADYQQKQQAMMQMLEEQDGDAEACRAFSADMDSIQSELMATPGFLHAMEAQSAFQELMNRVNKVVGACIGAPEEADEECGCTGSCGSCGGCMH